MPALVKSLKGQVDAVILTIRNDEDQAVAALLGKLEPTSGGRSYRVAKIPGATRDLTVALLRLIEPGNGPAQDAARDAIHELEPRMLVLVGIAGAVPAPELTLGDVMVATRVADLRVQALVPNALSQLDLRGERVHKKLADRLTNLVEPSGWADVVTHPRPQAPLDPDLFKGSEDWNEKITRSLRALFHTAGHKALAHMRVGVELARDISDRSLENGLAVVTPHLDAEQALEAMELAVTLARRDRAPAIEPWLALLPRALPARLDDVELRARALPQPWHRFEALVKIARLVAAEVPARAAAIRAEAIRVLRTEVPRPWGFLNLTARLATELEEPARAEVLAEACAIAEAVDASAPRASYCARLACIVTGGSRLHMATVAARAGCADQHEDGPGDALDLIPDVEDEVARRVLDEIIAAGRSDDVARWLGRHWQPERVSVAQRWARIVELLDEGDLARVREAWLEHLRERWHGSKDPTHLQDLVSAGLADEAIAIARESPEPRWRDVGLGHLAALLPIDERIELLTRLLASGDAPEWALESTIAAVADERPDVALALLPRAPTPIRARALARLAWRADGAERARLAVAVGAAARELEDVHERLRLLDDAHRLSGSDDLFRLVCEEIAALPARLDWLRRGYIQDLEDRCTPAQREVVERLTPGTDVPDEHILMPGAADARLRRTGRAGLAAIRRSDLRTRAALRLAELLAESGEQLEADRAIEDALRSSRMISDTWTVCRAAASLGPREPTMTAIIERARLVSDPAERFQALVAVLPHAGVAHETALAAAVDAAEATLDIPQALSRDFFIRHAPPERRDLAVTRLFDEVRGRCRELAPRLSRMRTADRNLDLWAAYHFDRDHQVMDLQRLLGEIAWALSPAQAEEALDLIPLHWTGHALSLLNVLARRDEAAHVRWAPMRLRVLDILRTRRGIERGGALAVLAYNVPSSEREEVIVEALAEARTEGDEHGRRDNRSTVLDTLAPLLDENHIDRVLPLAGRLAEQRRRPSLRVPAPRAPSRSCQRAAVRRGEGRRHPRDADRRPRCAPAGRGAGSGHRGHRAEGARSQRGARGRADPCAPLSGRPARAHPRPRGRHQPACGVSTGRERASHWLGRRHAPHPLAAARPSSLRSGRRDREGPRPYARRSPRRAHRARTGLAGACRAGRDGCARRRDPRGLALVAIGHNRVG